MKKKKQTPLWRITPPDGPVSYLFGTVHAPDSRAFIWFEPAVERLLSCDCYAGEFDLGEIGMDVFDAGIRLPEGQTLKELLPRGAWKQLEFLAHKRLGTHAGVLNGQHPFVVWSALIKSNLQHDYEASPDEMLWQTAMNAGKTVAGMESYSSQIDIVRRIPVKSHVTSLVRFLKYHRRAQHQTDNMLKMYATGNIQELARIARKSLRENRSILSDERNAGMAVRFEELSSCQSLFCAVGVAHLGGSMGLLRLLKQRGMRIEPDEKSLELFQR
jgi:hypothetical protein